MRKQNLRAAHAGNLLGALRLPFVVATTMLAALFFSATVAATAAPDFPENPAPPTPATNPPENDDVPTKSAQTPATERVLGRPKNHFVTADFPVLLRIAPSHDLPTLRLEPAARHKLNPIREDSGLAPCSTFQGAFWTINDSGSDARIFAIKPDGSPVRRETNDSKKQPRYRGVLVAGRRNIDWEAIASDGAGNLIIGDIGNNRSNRRNLCFYIVSEPSPYAETTGPARKISFYYPTQNSFPDPSLNYDAEACFVLDGFIYFFTKHWTNTETILWRVDPTTDAYQAAVPVARFDARGLVTDAAVSVDRSRLAVLTYHSIWLFDLPQERDEARPAPALFGDLPITRHFEEKFFTTGTPRYRKIASTPRDWQREGIEFLDDENLIVSSESGALFVIPIAEIK